MLVLEVGEGEELLCESGSDNRVGISDSRVGITVDICLLS